MFNYQTWLQHAKDFGHPPEHFWMDSQFHYWLRTGPFQFVCGAYGNKWKTVIGGQYFVIYNYDKIAHCAKNHLHQIVEEDGEKKFKTVFKCNHFQDAQLEAHRIGRNESR